MNLDRDDVRLAALADLAKLLGVYPQQISGWVSGSPYLDSQLDGACLSFGVSKLELVAGIELRRADYRNRKRAKERFATLFKSRNSDET